MYHFLVFMVEVPAVLPVFLPFLMTDFIVGFIGLIEMVFFVALVVVLGDCLLFIASSKSLRMESNVQMWSLVRSMRTRREYNA